MNPPAFSVSALSTAEKTRRTRILNSYASFEEVRELVKQADILRGFGDMEGYRAVMTRALGLSYPSDYRRDRDNSDAIFAEVAGHFGEAEATRMYFAGLSEVGVRYENQLDFAAGLRTDSATIKEALFTAFAAPHKRGDIARCALSHLLALGHEAEVLARAVTLTTGAAYEALMYHGFHGVAGVLSENLSASHEGAYGAAHNMLALIRHGRLEKARAALPGALESVPDSIRRKLLAAFADAAGDDAASEVVISNPGLICDDLFSAMEAVPVGERLGERKLRFFNLAEWACEHAPEMRPHLAAHFAALGAFDHAAACLLAKENHELSELAGALAKIQRGALIAGRLIEAACAERPRAQAAAGVLRAIVREGGRADAHAVALELAAVQADSAVLAEVADEALSLGLLDAAHALRVATFKRAVALADGATLEKLGHTEDAADAYERVTGKEGYHFGYAAEAEKLGKAADALARLGRKASAAKKYAEAIAALPNPSHHHLSREWRATLDSFNGVTLSEAA